MVTCAQKEYSASMKPIPLGKERRSDKVALATREESKLLRSGNGKISGLVRSAHMDIAVRPSIFRAESTAPRFAPAA